MNLRQLVKRSRLPPLAPFPARARTVTSYGWHQAKQSWAWLVGSREYTNFAYELATENVADSPQRRVMDPEPRYERRTAGYAIVPATCPQQVVEAGVNKGLGSCVFSAALLRNADEGHHGRLTALDINRDAGTLIGGKCASVIGLRYGDSIAMLAASASPVDLFFHGSDQHYDHESAEHRAVAGSLTESALVLTDNGGPALSDLGKFCGRRCLMFREDPADHWALGGVLGVVMRVAP